MTRHEEAAILLKRGYTLDQLAARWNILFSALSQILYTAVGRRLITFTEIRFAISEESAGAVESALAISPFRNRWDLFELFRKDSQSRIMPDDVGEALMYFDLRDAPLADMYASLCRLERFLHSYVKATLEGVYGREGWWSALPLAVRRQCVVRREEDREAQDDPYGYTTFIDLHDIFKEHWDHLAKSLSRPLSANRKEFLSRLQVLNGIRNRVMHPVRAYAPNREDFDLVTGFEQQLLGHRHG